MVRTRTALVSTVFFAIACGSPSSGGGGSTSAASTASTSPNLPADGAAEASSTDAGKCTPDNVKSGCFVCLESACCADLLACRDDKNGCLTFLVQYLGCKDGHLTKCWDELAYSGDKGAEKLAACALSGNVCRTACVD